MGLVFGVCAGNLVVIASNLYIYYVAGQPRKQRLVLNILKPCFFSDSGFKFWCVGAVP